MRIVDLIEKKKKGQTHSREEIEFIVSSLMNGEMKDYQTSAWLMAVYFRGLNLDETVDLTRALINSGEVLDWSSVSSCVVDKHSTGGVGDKITLILMPLIAACGLTMAKLSGKGLGHTGGTVDKLDSIPNFNSELELNEFFEQIKRINVAIASQSTKLTPADAKLYALRDVTATVDNVSLIASSVVSKKIASGANHIVIDLKCGNGAFIKTIDEAKVLADMMIKIGKRLDRSINVLITSMDEPLGRSIGNSLEIIETIEFLKGNTCDDLKELTFELASVLLTDTKKVADKAEAKKLLQTLIDNGEAIKKFEQIIQEQKGNTKVINDYSLFAQPKQILEIKSGQSAYIKEIDSLKIAKSAKLLGAGRDAKEDPIDYAVGVYLSKKVGEYVSQNETIAKLYINDPTNLEDAKDLVEQAFSFSETKPLKTPLILLEYKEN